MLEAASDGADVDHVEIVNLMQRCKVFASIIIVDVFTTI